MYLTHTYLFCYVREDAKEPINHSTKNKERRHDITKFDNHAYVFETEEREIYKELTNKYEEYNVLSLI